MERRKLRRIYKDGRVWIPAEIRRRFRGYKFGIKVENGGQRSYC